MKIELEKKYNLSREDYKIIRDNCEFIKEISLKDYYLDKDFILSKNKYYLRLRNGKYWLKIVSFNQNTNLATGKEFENEEEINEELNKFNINIDDTTWILFIDTKREKYKYIYKWNELNIDVEEYQYWTRYEIEIVYNEEDEAEDRNIIEDRLNQIIEEFRKELWLTAISDISSSKIITSAMHQNIKLYEVLTKNYI